MQAAQSLSLGRKLAAISSDNVQCNTLFSLYAWPTVRLLSVIEQAADCTALGLHTRRKSEHVAASPACSHLLQASNCS